VSFIQSVKGYFKCQHCGTLLRITKFGNEFLFFFIASVAIIVSFLLLQRRLFFIFGPSVTTAIWIILVLLTVFLFTYGTWKYARIEKADTKTNSTTKF